MYIILVYDIKTIADSARVTNREFKTCKKYLTHVQNSVFEGEISKVKYLELKQTLKQYLREKEDSCIIFMTNNEKWLKKEFLTDITDKTTNML